MQMRNRTKLMKRMRNQVTVVISRDPINIVEYPYFIPEETLTCLIFKDILLPPNNKTSNPTYLNV